MERGLGYVALGPADAALTFLGSAASAGKPYLWITERPSEHPPGDGQILRVTTVSGTVESVNPKRLSDLRAVAAAFVGDAADGVVLLDCIEYLVLHNGAERVERALADLHDEVTMHGGSLVVFVDVRVANPRLVAWLQRELDPLPAPADLVSEDVSLLV